MAKAKAKAKAAAKKAAPKKDLIPAKTLDSLSGTIMAPTPLISQPIEKGKLRPILDPVSLMSAPRWPHQHDCLGIFGNPFNPGWTAENLVHVTPPYAINMGNIHVSHIQINRIAAESLTRVLARIADMCGHDQAQIRAGHCNCFSGSYAARNMRGLNTISMHAFGLAIDWDAEHNPLGARGDDTFFDEDSLLVRAFKEEGWVWGGDWRGRRDAMHVQAAIV
jgi:hypothetical protein